MKPLKSLVMRFGANNQFFFTILVSLAFISVNISFTQVITDDTEYGTIIFKSGFEETTQVSSHPTNSKRQIITGVDGDYNWQDLSNQLTKSELFYLTKSSNHLEFAEAKILNAIGYNESKGILFETKKDDPADNEQTRVEYWMYPDYENNGVFSTQGFIRYKMKFDSTLNNVIWPSHWINFFETKQGFYPNRNYRFYLTVDKKVSETKPKWVFTRHNTQSDEKLILDNDEIPVPIDEWMNIEIFWKKHHSKGRLFLKVNEEIVFDFVGQTQHPTNPQHTDFFSPMKNYRSREWHDGSTTSKIWYDDLELWSGFPRNIGFSIQNYNPPTNLVAGESYTLNIPYRATGEADVRVSLQNTDDSWKSEGSAKISVNDKTGTANLNVAINANALSGTNYQWQAYITPLGGNWDNRYDNKRVDFVTVESTLNTKALEINNNISIYPNPINEFLYIQSKNKVESVSIYSINGQLLISEPFQREINVSGLGQGIYFFKLKTDNVEVIKKFIKL